VLITIVWVAYAIVFFGTICRSRGGEHRERDPRIATADPLVSEYNVKTEGAAKKAEAPWRGD